jgi:hypothetical protein
MGTPAGGAAVMSHAIDSPAENKKVTSLLPDGDQGRVKYDIELSLTSRGIKANFLSKLKIYIISRNSFISEKNFIIYKR